MEPPPLPLGRARRQAPATVQKAAPAEGQSKEPPPLDSLSRPGSDWKKKRIAFEIEECVSLCALSVLSKRPDRRELTKIAFRSSGS